MQNSSMLYRLVFGGGWCGWSLCVHIFWGKLLVDVSNWQATQAILLLVSTKTIILQIFRSRLPFPPPKKKTDIWCPSTYHYLCISASFWVLFGSQAHLGNPKNPHVQVPRLQLDRSRPSARWGPTEGFPDTWQYSFWNGEWWIDFWLFDIYLSGKPCYLALVTRSFIHLWFFFMHSDVTWLLTQWDLPRTTRPQTRELIEHCRGIVSRSTMSYSDLFHLHTIHNS